MATRRVFWLLLLLAIVGAFHYRHAGLDFANFSYKFSRLYWTKQKVLEVQAGPDTINIYVEPSLEPADFIKSDQLGGIIKESYGHYRLFLEKHYPQIVNSYPDNWLQKKAEQVGFIFVSQTTFETLEKINLSGQKIERHTTNAYQGFFNMIYFKVSTNIDARKNDYFTVTELKPVIRHEIFHYLNNYFKLTGEFEESAAKRFGEDF